MSEATLTEVTMPRLSDSMEEGVVLTWHKQVGEPVAVGEEIVEIETDKANMGYESEVAGTLAEILVEAGESAPIGAPIALIGAPGAAPRPAASKPAAPVQPRSQAAAPAPITRSAEANERVKASPLARRVAAALGVDLSSVVGSGPGGRVVKADVAAAAAGNGDGATVTPPASVPVPAAPEPTTAKGRVEAVEPSRLQAIVARRMAEAKATVPHFYLEAEIDMSAAVAARARLKALARDGERLPSFNDMIVKACALALREFPHANGAYRDGRFELYSRVNVGIAVTADEGLLVPTVFDADRKGLREIATDSARLAERARAGEITPPELAGATFTVSNLGMFGVRSFNAVINSPQAAILAVGEIAERASVRDGEVRAAPLMAATLSCDHRVLYGADGARFLRRVRDLLEEPLQLAL